jgi:site-specific recombinase XerC
MPDLISYQENARILMPKNPDKDTKSRLRYFLEWLSLTGRGWHQPDLAEYRDYLLLHRTRLDVRTGNDIPARLAPITVRAHLATIRGRYSAILRNNHLRDWLYGQIPPAVTGAANRKAHVDELLVRIQNAVHPTTAEVAITTHQDDPDSAHLRLKPRQVQALLRTPGLGTLPGLRDTALIAMFVCTGIREAELVALDVSDLRETLGGELALLVRDGKGNKQRMVPYGSLDWCLLYVERWLERAMIYRGPVFRGFYKGYKRVRDTRISKRAVNLIMNRYPISIDGHLRTVNPHDLRRSYARNAYLNGMDLERIRQNLGHASLQTTQIYIGTLDASQRQPPPMFAPPHDLSRLYE